MLLGLYHLDVKCNKCGKRAGEHNATTGACPWGMKHRGFQSFSSDQTFSPKHPRMRKVLLDALGSLIDAAIEEENNPGHLPSRQAYEYAHWKLLMTINEVYNGQNPKLAPRPIKL